MWKEMHQQTVVVLPPHAKRKKTTTCYSQSDGCVCRATNPGGATKSAWTADAASESAKVNSKLRFRMLSDGREEGSEGVLVDGIDIGEGEINE